MTIRHRFSMLAASLLVAVSAAAELDTAIAAPAQTEASAEAPGPAARERGLDALQAGDYLAAAADFQEATAWGDTESMRHLGDMAFDGMGLAQSYDRAIHWYCQSALASDADSVDRLENIQLSSWSARRDAQGWKMACKQWLKPFPAPVERETGPASPEVNIEINVQPEREPNAPTVFWPGYVHRHGRWVKPRHPPQKPVRPHPPVYVPGGIDR